MKKSRLLGASLACLSSLSIIGTANAAFILTIDDLDTLGVDQTLTDGDNDGLISFNGSVGAFTVNITTGVSKPLISSPQLLHLDNISVTTVGAG